jgi:tetratricopeptide (TPR) repeat protein
MRKVLVVLFIIAVIVSIALVVRAKRANSAQNEEPKRAEAPLDEKNDMAMCRRMLEENKPQQAIEIIKQYENPAMIHSENGKAWLHLLIDAYTMQNDARRLSFLYAHLPDFFSQHEKASIIVLHTLIDQEKFAEIETLRNFWKGKETLEPHWISVDANILCLQNKKEAAKQLLLSKEFEGKDDVGRLCLLALLTMGDNPNKALQYLVAAQKKDSQNAYIYLLRAKILETFGEKELARFEYTVALQLNPHSIAYRDELAEFYRRQGNLEQAIQIWKDCLTPPSSDVIWLKLLFWSKVYHVLDINWDAIQKPESNKGALIDYLLSLPKDTFWNEESYKKVEDGSKYLHTQQFTLWLRLIQYLKDGNERAALELLQTNPFKAVSWDPILEKSLVKVATYRETGILPLEPIVDSSSDPKKEKRNNAMLTSRHPFFFDFNTLCKSIVTNQNKLSLPPEMQALFSNNDVYSALFLAAAWPQAAISLLKDPILAKELPSWVPADMIAAYRFLQGPQQAICFAEQQPQNETVQLQIAEILLDLRRFPEATTRLEKLSSLPSDIGFRASYLLCSFAFQGGNLEMVKEKLKNNKQLEKSTLGKEMQARVCLAEGNPEAAMRIYSAIENESAEAKSFLAQKAFDEKNFARAKKLTEDLLKKFPNNPTIQLNYLRLLDAEKNQTATPEPQEP